MSARRLCFNVQLSLRNAISNEVNEYELGIPIFRGDFRDGIVVGYGIDQTVYKRGSEKIIQRFENLRLDIPRHPVHVNLTLLAERIGLGRKLLGEQRF